MSIYSYPHEYDGPTWTPSNIAYAPRHVSVLSSWAVSPRDPVCRMTVSPTTAHRVTFGGQDVLFCSARCKNKFDAHPAMYNVPAHAHHTTSSATGATGAEYTCPMHPQIVRTGPGSCPICGMELERRLPNAGQEAGAGLREMTRWFWLAAALTVSLLFIAIADFEAAAAIVMMILLGNVVGLWARRARSRRWLRPDQT